MEQSQIRYFPPEGTVIIDCDTNKIRFKRKEVTHSSETTNHQNDNESSETSDIDEKRENFWIDCH